MIEMQSPLDKLARTAYELPHEDASGRVNAMFCEAADSALELAEQELGVTPHLRWLTWKEREGWTAFRHISLFEEMGYTKLTGEDVIWVAVENLHGKPYGIGDVTRTVLHECRHRWQIAVGFEGDKERDAEEWAVQADRRLWGIT